MVPAVRTIELALERDFNGQPPLLPYFAGEFYVIAGKYCIESENNAGVSLDNAGDYGILWLSVAQGD